MSALIIQTCLPHCRLRSWSTEDAPSLAENADNMLIWNNLRDSFPHPFTLKHADDWIAFVQTSQAGFQLAIEVGGLAVGNIGLRSPDMLGTSEFGYWLGEAYWGQGIASAAVRAFLVQVSRFEGMRAIEAPVYAWNAVSIHILEKSGFVRIAEYTDREQKRGLPAPSFRYRLTDEYIVEHR